MRRAAHLSRSARCGAGAGCVAIKTNSCRVEPSGCSRAAPSPGSSLRSPACLPARERQQVTSPAGERSVGQTGYGPWTPGPCIKQGVIAGLQTCRSFRIYTSHYDLFVYIHDHVHLDAVGCWEDGGYRLGAELHRFLERAHPSHVRYGCQTQNLI